MKKGLEHFIYRELTIFSGQGTQISLFSTKFNPGLYNAPDDWDLHRWNLIAVTLLQPLFFLSSPLLYLRLLREAIETHAYVDFVLAWYFARDMANVDVIYATFGDHKLFVGYFCKKITGKPLAVTIHAYELYQNPNPALFLRALALCDQVITVTEYNRELLIEKFGVPAAKIEVVRISVDVTDYRPQEKFVILIVAFFAERKGHEILFKAVKQLDQKDIEIWIVGDQGTESRTVNVEALAAELGIASQVAFFGKLSKNALKAVYRECDVFCLPCRTDGDGVNEGFPTVIAEAMAFGKPVISTRHVEIPRVLDELLVDENDVEGLADAIRQVRESAQLRQTMGEKNRLLSEKVFSTHNAERTVQILNRLSHRPESTIMPMQVEVS
ncbi:MAG: glycosyltransferase family 4 protein [Chloroflexota bacterium]